MYRLGRHPYLRRAYWIKGQRLSGNYRVANTVKSYKAKGDKCYPIQKFCILRHAIYLPSRSDFGKRRRCIYKITDKYYPIYALNIPF